MFVLLGDSITELGSMENGWQQLLTKEYVRKVRGRAVTAAGGGAADKKGARARTGPTAVPQGRANPGAPSSAASGPAVARGLRAGRGGRGEGARGERCGRALRPER
jgi:hypothetical protein